MSFNIFEIINDVKNKLIKEFVEDLKKLPYDMIIDDEVHQLTLKWEEK